MTNRTEAITQAIQTLTNITVDQTIVLEIIKAIDQADLENGIVRVSETPNTQQKMTGMRVLCRGGSPSDIYKEMVKSGITNTDHPVYTKFD